MKQINHLIEIREKYKDVLGGRLGMEKDHEKPSVPAPLLSILCITYNHEKFISQALESLLMQEVNFPVEIVVGEDCSEDETALIIQNYKKTYPSLIRVITSESNVGVVENFRRTLGACKGKYVAICEGDDYWADKHKIQTQVDFLENHPEYVITYHDAYPFDELGASSSLQLSSKYQCDATQEDLINTRPISTLTACFRNVITDLPSEFNHTPILDICIWSMLGNHGKGKYLPNIMPAAYRIHDGGVFSKQTGDRKIRMTMQAFLCLSNYYERIGNEKVNKHFAFHTVILGFSQVTIYQKIRLIVAQLDSLLGSPFYRFLRFFGAR